MSGSAYRFTVDGKLVQIAQSFMELKKENSTTAYGNVKKFEKDWQRLNAPQSG